MFGKVRIIGGWDYTMRSDLEVCYTLVRTMRSDLEGQDHRWDYFCLRSGRRSGSLVGLFLLYVRVRTVRAAGESDLYCCSSVLRLVYLFSSVYSFSASACLVLL